MKFNDHAITRLKDLALLETQLDLESCWRGTYKIPFNIIDLSRELLHEYVDVVFESPDYDG